MNNLRRIRKEQALSQTALSERSGVHQTVISKIERLGLTPKKKSVINSLARALSVFAFNLFPEDDNAAADRIRFERRKLFRSDRYSDYAPAPLKPPQDAFGDEPPKPEPVPMTRTICRWCGMSYRPENEVKIMVGENVIKTYGHLTCLEEDVRTDGLEIKKRHVPR